MNHRDNVVIEDVTAGHSTFHSTHIRNCSRATLPPTVTKPDTKPSSEEIVRDICTRARTRSIELRVTMEKENTKIDHSPPKKKAATSEVKCEGCSLTFPSRNLLFRHLRETNGACLSAEDREDFVRYVRNADRVKVIILYGYIPSKKYLCRNPPPIENDDRSEVTIRNGEDAARLVLNVVYSHASVDPTKDDLRINRSYGHSARSSEVVAQDDCSGALTEVMAARLPRVAQASTEGWVQEVNALLEKRLDSNADGAKVCVLGRLEMSQKRFNTEMDMTHRRVEYIIPADFLCTNNTSKEKRQKYFDSLKCFSSESHSTPSRSKQAQEDRPDKETIMYLYELKKTMQKLTTQVEKLDENDKSAVMEKEFHLQKRKRQRHKQLEKDHKSNPPNQSKQSDSENPPKEGRDGNGKGNGQKDRPQKKASKASRNVLRRRRFHNFTPRLMAHEFLAYRRLDRVYHRGTLRFPDIADSRPFVSISLKGDLFLNGQCCRVIGLLLALVRGVIDPDIVDCIFDEQYPHLVPAPPVPSMGLFAGEASYMAWEGKTKLILCPRNCDRYEGGWRDVNTLEHISNWQQIMHEQLADAWMQEGLCEETGRLVSEKRWTEEVLEPWAERARKQLLDYREWKSAQQKMDEPSSISNPVNDSTLLAEALLPSPESIDATVPKLFEKVLHHLREADRSGNWPTTTPKRQLVMISTQSDNNSTSENDATQESSAGVPAQSLSMAHMIAKSNTTKRSSAYSFAEGEGGASGSFSVGAMPGIQCTQPKGNSMFPELMKAAFELEIALCPDREPSSTIAINRNAQFRPHTDSGAGAGQSTSLIVGLGTYAGGELMVEGEKKDIRYKGVEFNGWKQRHWTMPFRGERYSLVWFTPKGCEGVHGIDLCS